MTPDTLFTLLTIRPKMLRFKISCKRIEKVKQRLKYGSIRQKHDLVIKRVQKLADTDKAKNFFSRQITRVSAMTLTRARGSGEETDLSPRKLTPTSH